MNPKWHQFNVVDKRTLPDKGKSCVKVILGLTHVKTLQLVSPTHLSLDFFRLWFIKACQENI